MALHRLAEFVEDPSIASRQPNCCLSFSCVTPEVYQSQMDILDKEQSSELTAISPLGLDGRTLRKYGIAHSKLFSPKTKSIS